MVYILLGCNPIENEKADKKMLAKVNNKILFAENLKGLIPHNATRKDSIDFTKRYIDNWVKRQILVELASSKVDAEGEEISKKVQLYKESLILYEFEKQYIYQNLDTIVVDSQIVSYYQKHRANFELKQNIVKGVFARFPLDAPKMQRIKDLVANCEAKDMVELKSYCFRFANSYYLSENNWIDIDKIVKNTPFSELANSADFVRSNKFYEIKDDNFIYLLGIKDYKISDQISPLEYVKSQITNIIVNERKLKLIAKLESETLIKAKSNKNIEIFP